MNKLIIIAILLLLATGCRTTKEIKVREVEKIKEVEVIVRDSITVIEEDIAIVRALLECDSLYQVVFKELEMKQGTRLSQEIIYKDNIIEVQARVDSMLIYHKLHSRIERQTEDKIEYVEKTVYKPYYPRWLVISAIFGGLSALFFLLRLIIYLRKKLL